MQVGRDVGPLLVADPLCPLLGPGPLPSRTSHGPTMSARPSTPRMPATTTSRATEPRPVWAAKSTRATTSSPTPVATRA